jgi:hypothetical protein
MDGFLNVDLEVGARLRAPLMPLLAALDGKLFELFRGRLRSLYRAHYQTRSCGRNATTTIHDIAAVIEALDPPVRRVWDAATMRDFNIGIELARGNRTLRTIAVAAVACSCSSKASDHDRYELHTASDAGSTRDIVLVAITKDDRVRLFPGSPLEQQDFMKGKPEYHIHLRGESIVSDTGREQVACRDHRVFVNDQETARLVDDGFEREGDPRQRRPRIARPQRSPRHPHLCRIEAERQLHRGAAVLHGARTPRVAIL